MGGAIHSTQIERINLWLRSSHDMSDTDGNIGDSFGQSTAVCAMWPCEMWCYCAFEAACGSLTPGPLLRSSYRSGCCECSDMQPCHGSFITGCVILRNSLLRAEIFSEWKGLMINIPIARLGKAKTAAHLHSQLKRLER